MGIRKLSVSVFEAKRLAKSRTDGSPLPPPVAAAGSLSCSSACSGLGPSPGTSPRLGRREGRTRSTATVRHCCRQTHAGRR